jgi:hypothetical protein
MERVMPTSTPNSAPAREMSAENDKQTLIRKLIDGIKQYDIPQAKTTSSESPVKETR